MAETANVSPTSRRVLILGGLLVALAAGGLAAYFASDSRAKEQRKGLKGPPPVPVSVVKVEQRNLPVRLRSIGNVEAFATVAVKARVDGQIIAVNFREGEAVKKSAVLFRIDAHPYEAALRQAESNSMRDIAARDQARSQAKRYQE